MPFMKKSRSPYTEKQKLAAARSRKRRLHTDQVRSIRLRGSLTSGKKDHWLLQLKNYLIAYDARLIEIDKKYPFGNPDRSGWLLAHRKNGLKRIRQIVQAPGGGI